MVNLLQWEIGLLLGGLALVVFYQMLTGHITLTGLLREKDESASFSPGRVQYLFFTLIFRISLYR